MTSETPPTLDAGARKACDAVRSTLGPFGANKLVVEPDGTVSTTGSGSVALDRLDVDDPGFTVLADAAADFRDEHGDGATSVALLAGALLDEAAGLRERGVHPTTIARGYDAAADAAASAARDLHRPVDAAGLDAVAETALTGVRDPGVRRHLAARLASLAADLGDDFGPDAVRVAARVGGTPGDTEFVPGVVLDTRPAHDSMPRDPDRDGVALLSDTVDLPAVDGGVTLETGDFETRRALADHERARFSQRLDALVDAGVGFVATERAVNDRVKTILAARGVLAVQRVDAADLSALAAATGATVVPGLDQCTPDAVGRGDARLVRKAGRDHTVVEAPGATGTYTLFCRAPDPRSLTEFESAVEAAVAAVDAARTDGAVVPGGGAAEMHASRAVHDHARTVADRRQVAVRAFGDALTAVPRTLAETAGLRGVDALAALAAAHADGRVTTGVDARTGDTTALLGDDPVALPASRPPAVWRAAADVAIQVLRVDDLLPATSDDADEEPGADAPA